MRESDSLLDDPSPNDIVGSICPCLDMRVFEQSDRILFQIQVVVGRLYEENKGEMTRRESWLHC